MNYEYRAINSEGGVINGVVAADDLRVAARRLRQQGLNLVSLNPAVQRVQPGGAFKRRVKPQDVMIVMHQLCTLLESSVGLDDSVESLAQSAGQPELAAKLTELGVALRHGVSFSEALQSSDLKLPPYFQPLAEAGELTGKLAQALRDGVSQWEYELKTSAEMRNALTYPVILVVSGFAAIMLIFTMVVPKFVNLLNKAHGDVPLLARLVLGGGAFVNDNLRLLLGLAVVGLVVGYYVLANRETRQSAWDLLARQPIFREWILEADIGRWAVMVATLLENRVPLLNALELARKNIKTSSLKAQYVHVSKSVRGGASLADSLRDSVSIPATGYNLVRSGENSGQLPSMLRSLGKLYSESVRNRTKRFLLLLEPIAILVIGLVVGLVMAGIILAITSVNDISL